jgi:hypothetical protein
MRRDLKKSMKNPFDDLINSRGSDTEDETEGSGQKGLSGKPYYRMNSDRFIEAKFLTFRQMQIGERWELLDFDTSWL